MTGEGAKRFCASCNKEVHDVAALTRREAEALIRESRGTLCFHIHVRRSDGAILLADGHATPAPRGGAPAKKLVATVAAATAALAACAPKPASTHETTPQASFEVSVQPAAAAPLAPPAAPLAPPAAPAPSTGSTPPKASEPAKATSTSPSQAKPPAKHYVVIDGQGPWND